MSRPPLSLDITLALARDGDARGALFSASGLEAVRPRVAAAAGRVEGARGEERLAFLELPNAYGSSTNAVFGSTFETTLETIRGIAKDFNASSGQLMHLGIGGSALGASLLVAALAPKALTGRQRSIYVADNVDPDGFHDMVTELDLGRTFVNVVSKSGGTVETVATFAYLWDRLVATGVGPAELRRRVFVTTNPEAGALAEFAKREGLQILPLPHAVHGRFSVLSPMGLFTAGLVGVDLEGLLTGARLADEDTAKNDFSSNPAHQLAALHLLALEAGFSNLVLLPYSDRLRLVGDWYSQLVAESLGKGGQGLTPVKALGATDQHSQLQLYNDGPKDKLIVFFAVGQHDHTLVIPESVGRTPEYAYLAKRSINELFAAERRATEVSVHVNGVPSCRFDVGRVDAVSIGYLLTVLEKCVCILGELTGVNAFNQPGVEESKEYARAMLGKAGADYDALRQRVQSLG